MSSKPSPAASPSSTGLIVGGVSGIPAPSSSTSSAAAAAAVAKAKSRSSTTHATQVAARREHVPHPNLPASHVTTGQVRSSKLEEEAAAMENRLSALKASMNVEREKRAALVAKNKSGTIWKSAQPVQNDKKNYMEDVMHRIEKRLAKANTAAAAPTAGAFAGAGAIMVRQGSAGISARGGSSATSSTAASSARSSLNGSTATDLAATVKSSYVPPIQPKNAISAPSAPRVQGQGNNTQRPSSSSSNPSHAGSNQTPRTNGVTSSSLAASSSAAASDEPPSYVNPADDPNRSAAPGSLLDGDFDEQENKKWFAEARNEWLAQSNMNSNNSAAAAAATPGKKVQLVHDPDYSPAVPANPNATGAGEAGGSSLLDGPAFDERESARDFQEARRAWIQSLTPGEGNSAAGSKQQQHTKIQRASENAGEQGGWNPLSSVVGRSSILFPDDDEEASHKSSNNSATPAPTVSSELRASQSGLEKSAKTSCYNCYRLFYTSGTGGGANNSLPNNDLIHRSAVFPSRNYCSRACVEADERSSLRIACENPGCVMKRARDDMIPQADGKLFCDNCVKNKTNKAHHEEVRRNSIEKLLSPETREKIEHDSTLVGRSGEISVNSSQESIPHASSDDEDEEGRCHHHHQHHGGPAVGGATAAVAASTSTAERPMSAAAARSIHNQQSRELALHEAALIRAKLQADADAAELAEMEKNDPSSRPASAAVAATLSSEPAPKFVVDTSVIHKAKSNEPAAAPVVEFPSDEED